MNRRGIRRCLPPATAIQDWYAGADLLDAYCMRIPEGATRDARVLARLALERPTASFRALMSLRDRIVAPLGLKSSSAIRAESEGATRIDFFPVLMERAEEVLVGENDRHLDFRTSMMVVPDGASALFVSTTAVRCHNWTGRVYLALIRSFHIAVVKAGLRGLHQRLVQAQS